MLSPGDLMPELRRGAKRLRHGRTIRCRPGCFKPKLHEVSNQRMKIILDGKLLKASPSDFTVQYSQGEAKRFA